jgi:FkbM family methyltransferase
MNVPIATVRGPAPTADRYFEAHAAYWRDIYDVPTTQAEVFRDRHDAAVAWMEGLPRPAGARALDIGCGAGFLSVQMAERGYQVEAIDASEAMVALARKSAAASPFAATVNVQSGDVYALPFADGTFDLVVAIALLPWLPRTAPAIREIARVLKPGGHVLLTADNDLRLNTLLDPRYNPQLDPLRRRLKDVLVRRGLRQASVFPTARFHRRGFVDGVLGRAGLRKVAGRTIGFGPFTFAGRALVPERIGIALHRRLQRLADRRLPGLEATGAHYLVMARKSELDFGPHQHLADALSDAERFRARSRVGRFARRPAAGSVVSAFRMFPSLPPLKRRAHLFTGQPFTVVLPELLSREVYLHGFFEAPLTRILLALLRPDMVFADVGAQYGYYSVLAHRLVGRGGRVFAFEPTPTTYSVLRENVAGLPGVVAEDIAANSTAGVVRMHDFGQAHSGLNSLLPQPRVSKEEARTLRAKGFDVQSVRLDDYFAARGVDPDFVKIDVESAEIHVLTGMDRLLREARPIVSVEVGDLDVAGAGESGACIRFLEERGYRCLEYRAGGLHPVEARARYEHDNLLFVPMR